LIAIGTILTSAPPIFGIPLAAYLAIGLLLVGGIVVLPWAMAWLLHHLQPLAARHALALLALERARRMRGTAAIAVGGVVASLSLAVALTVMVSSFRGSVTQWLDAVLPSPLYVRLALGVPGSEAALLPAGFAESVAQLPGLARVRARYSWMPRAPRSRSSAAHWVTIRRKVCHWWARPCACPRGALASTSARRWWTCMGYALVWSGLHFLMLLAPWRLIDKRNQLSFI
jgi:hypothetical protein